MATFVANIVAILMTRLTAWLMARGLEILHGQDTKAVTNKEIDAKLAGLKAAYKEAFNGDKVTPGQRTALKRAISDFIRNPDSSPGL